MVNGYHIGHLSQRTLLPLRVLRSSDGRRETTDWRSEGGKSLVSPRLLDVGGVIGTGCLFHLEPSLQIPSFSTLSGVIIGELKPQDCLMLF